MARLRSILLLLLMGVAFAVMVAWSSGKWGDQDTMESLVDYVAKRGTMGRVAREGLEYFGLPSDDNRVRTLRGRGVETFQGRH
jgi:hypothetical protein